MAYRDGVPAYPPINHHEDMNEPGGRSAVRLRAMTSNFRAWSGDGVYIFNWGGIPESSERQACCGRWSTLTRLRA